MALPAGTWRECRPLLQFMMRDTQALRLNSILPHVRNSVPTWAEIRPGKQSGYMKQRRKTALCRQWLDARQHRLPPRGAPRWWGCPRGKDCDWAHGEEELRGQVRSFFLHGTPLHPVAPGQG